ncbi:hypothetical protein AUEXF2481DRAFT_260416 [Aureobasidium subglaciale EXF-2481]|uniref:Uncharacterized protein n=1 Tax=Aureobasidium subglaciale (strain EXF-2481) TaxID=1043005 RepID=A0A074Z7F5_AURSE|nr:uncharacterized protein AUEXF2481DRAFT_260416 [Aureobasidium subglaciale EXF-2481]KEQ94816.1 hypothetical protein AUEXF2481DRAFT_260416 [Aureobasidium subglaciale EXF-2481]
MPRKTPVIGCACGAFGGSAGSIDTYDRWQYRRITARSYRRSLVDVEVMRQVVLMLWYSAPVKRGAVDCLCLRYLDKDARLICACCKDCTAGEDTKSRLP